MLTDHLLCYLSFLPFLLAQNSSFHESSSASALSSSQSALSSLLVSTSLVSTSASSAPTQPIIQTSVSSDFTPFPVPSDIPETGYPATDPSYPPAVSCLFLPIFLCSSKFLSRPILVFFLTLVPHGPLHGKRPKLRYEIFLPRMRSPLNFSTFVSSRSMIFKTGRTIVS